jgi:predicted transcriptional regulator
MQNISGLEYAPGENGFIVKTGREQAKWKAIERHLVDKGLLTLEKDDGRSRVYQLTDAGYRLREDRE